MSKTTNGNGSSNGTHAIASKKLTPEKVLEAIWGLPAELRSDARSMLKKELADRQGSEKWIREHPKATPVTKAQKIKMALMHQHGASFRSLEAIYHLIPNSGNGAQRCVEQGLQYLKEKAGKSKSKLVSA